ncbi:hypothetical protein [Candidatus Protochlamydia phocaeensis]|uniref:hypothetical protein n=1 Tax=Candidatus Protochlamydia phocaeensis TaxID=1414722 RepID=UPI000838F696|nr:hypothetical protein [Candidatus Protochlamydia phocaeensis]
MLASLQQAKGWLLALIFISLLAAGYAYQSTPFHLLEQRQEEIVEAAKQLPQSGILKQNPDGYVYLKVDDQYIHRLLPFVDEPGFHKPGSLNRPSKVGAHISVMYKKEGQESRPIEELGKAYSFRIKDFRYVKSKGKTFAILELDAPELEQLRERYGLSPKLLGHEFHITIAEKFKNHSRGR